MHPAAPPDIIRRVRIAALLGIARAKAKSYHWPNPEKGFRFSNRAKRFQMMLDNPMVVFCGRRHGITTLRKYMIEIMGQKV